MRKTIACLFTCFSAPNYRYPCLRRSTTSRQTKYHRCGLKAFEPEHNTHTVQYEGMRFGGILIFSLSLSVSRFLYTFAYRATVRSSGSVRTVRTVLPVERIQFIFPFVCPFRVILVHGIGNLSLTVACAPWSVRGGVRRHETSTDNDHNIMTRTYSVVPQNDSHSLKADFDNSFSPSDSCCSPLVNDASTL